MLTVVFLETRLAWLRHFKTHKFVSLALEPGNDLPDHTSLDPVGLNHDEGTLALLDPTVYHLIIIKDIIYKQSHKESEVSDSNARGNECGHDAKLLIFLLLLCHFLSEFQTCQLRVDHSSPYRWNHA